MRILEENDDLSFVTNLMIEFAKLSTCKRSKCGSIIVANRALTIGKGQNSMPCHEVGECFKDSLHTSFKSDRTCCMHAEQRAIIDALQGPFSRWVRGSTLFFIRLDENNNPVHAGKPYCSICSKMALDVGIKWFVLWHKDGWTAYDTKEYNDLTFQYNGG